MDVPLERGVVRRQRIRRRDDQFPWLDRIRPEVYRLDQRGLGREAVCRSNEGARLRRENYPFIDKNREAALGASYGGYMANWILGHTDRFKCIVSHDGMFNTESA